MWARVEFVGEKNTWHDVPITCFKESNEVRKELAQGKIRENYRVFWSKDPDETPEHHLKIQGKIVDVNNVKKTTKSAYGITGYYLATLIHHADTLEKLLIVVDSAKGRRPVSPNIKEVASCASNKRKRNQAKKATAEKSRKKIFELVERADDHVAKDKTTIAASNTPATTQISSSSEDDEDISAKDVNAPSSSNVSAREVHTHEEVAALEAQISSLQETIQQLREENERLRKRNDSLVDLTIFLNNKDRGKSESRSCDRDRREKSHEKSHRSGSKHSNDHHSSVKKSNSSQDFSAAATCSSAKPQAASPNLSKENELPQNTGSVVLLDTIVPVSTVQPIPKPLPDGPIQMSCTSTLATHLPHVSDIGSETLSLSDSTNINIEAMDFQFGDDEMETAASSKDDNDGLTVENEKPNTGNKNLVAAESLGENVHMTRESKPHETDKGTKKKRVCGGIHLDKDNFKLQAPPGVPYISYERFIKNAQMVKMGEAGDSQFIKNHCDDLWSSDVLRNRSASGKACPTLNKAAKQECSPTKKAYLRDLLALRISSEINPSTSDEVQQRTSMVTVNSYIRAKINTLNRAVAVQQRRGDPV